MGILRLIMDTVKSWIDDGGPQWSAAIAYYSVLSLAPLLILVASLAGIAFDEAPVELIRDQLRLVLGSRGAEFAATLLEDANLPDGGIPSLLGNLAILLVGATIVFANVQGALNRIWGLRWIKGGVVHGVLRKRLLAFAMIVITGVIMLGSLGLSTVAGLMSQQLTRAVGGTFWVSALDAGVSILVLGVLFAASFRVLPDGEVAWKDVSLGAAVTACLFVLGKMLVGNYLTRASLVGSYGVTGSLVFFLVWVYYSAAIFFLGAEFTQKWAQRQGRPIEPNSGAVRVEERLVPIDEGPV